MDISIRGIRWPGTLEKERVALIVKKSCDMGKFMLATTKSTDNDSGVSPKFSHIYWLNDNQVSENDLIVIYTKIGKKSIKENSDGTKTYFYYIGRTTPLYTEENDCAVLIEVRTWTVKRINNETDNEKEIQA